jgi:hypothetical protein
MKSKILNVLFCLSLCATAVFQSCEKDDDPEPLVANAGEDFTAAPLTTVSLDGTASTPPDQIQYEWEYSSGPVQEDQITFQGQFTANATFIPPQNGTYFFILNITRGNEFMTDNVTVTVEGFITLVNSSEQMNLADIEPDPSKPDYKLNEILTFTGSNALVANTQGTNGIVVECSEGAGIVVTGGVQNVFGVKFVSPSGWKGFSLQGGYTTLDGVTVEKGGKSLFQNATEAAAITTSSSGTLNLLRSTFTGTTGYDVLLQNATSHTLSSNIFNSSKPIKAPIELVSAFRYNNFQGAYDYITLVVPSGSNTYVTSSINSEFRFDQEKKYFIDGDFNASSLISFESGASIFMKENAGIVAGQGVYCQTSSSNKATIDGLNSALWKGIVLAGSSSMSMSNVIIKNAGSQVFSTGSISTDVKAAIHVNRGTTFNGVEIINSQGYGISWSNPDTPPGMINNTFVNGLSAPIRVSYHFAPFLLRENHGNTFSMAAGIPAVEMYGNSSLFNGTTVLRPLHGSNYYLATTNIVLSANFALSPGVKIKFASGRSMTGSGVLTAVGTAEAPIILEGTIDSPGSWSGILLEGLFNIEHCQIKNGGQNLMAGATAPAALVIKYNGGTNATNFTFKNNTVTGSTGLGVLIEVGGKDPGITDPANNNSYSNNTAGNTLKK